MVKQLQIGVEPNSRLQSKSRIGRSEPSDLPLSDRHMSAPIRTGGCLRLHVVPITPDHEVAILFGCRRASPPGDARFTQSWDHLRLYVPCYDSLMVLVTVWQQSARREEEEKGEREKVREWKRKAKMSTC
ncbi:hypothetical protein EYF80_039747 [Liparis tanakae]|uniref:Uncharacterized protein n=1 Tax=Liparis tanakae TaxID=230148 RepID=A0A4Z2G973_9TELE|nr:hypothetical protein EYF80_039747 [Liparis tanakae]